MNPIPDDNPIPDGDQIPDGDLIPDGELLSAYLDGELSADERARVERLLAERPESRQLLDELRALRGTLEGVPRYRLEDDFAARVLRAAERAMLSGDPLFSGQTEPSAPVEGDAHAEGDAAEANGHSREAGKPVPAAAQEATWSTREAGWSWRRARRPMVWSCLALAAGLLIMLAQPDGPLAPREHKVALGSRNAEMGAATRDDVSLRKMPSPGADQGVESSIRDAELHDLGPEHQDERHQDERHRGEESTATLGLSPPPSAPATASQSPGALGGGASAGNKARAPSEPSHEAVGPAPPSRAAGGMPGRGARMADPKKDEPIEPDARRNSAVDAVQALGDDPTADNTLLIVCDVASDLVDSPELQQLLAKHDIILEQVSDEPPKGVKEETAPLRGDVAGESSEEKVNDTYADRELGTFLKRRRAFGAVQGEGRDSVFEALDDALQVGEAEGLLVEATEAQLEAVVADFERQSELFLSVAVHPAPDVPEQQALTAFSRALPAANRPAAPTADAAAQDTPLPADAADATRADTEDDVELKDRPAATPDAGSETAEEFAAPLVQGRAKRLESRKLAELRQIAANDFSDDVKPETAPASKAGDQPTSKTPPPSKAQSRSKTGKEPTGAAANGDAGRQKSKRRSDQDDKSKSAGASDVAEQLSSQGKAGDGAQGGGQDGMARKATKGASVPRRALLIFRHVAPDAIESVPAEDP